MNLLEFLRSEDSASYHILITFKSQSLLFNNISQSYLVVFCDLSFWTNLNPNTIGMINQQQSNMLFSLSFFISFFQTFICSFVHSVFFFFQFFRLSIFHLLSFLCLPSLPPSLLVQTVKQGITPFYKSVVTPPHQWGPVPACSLPWTTLLIKDSVSQRKPRLAGGSIPWGPSQISTKSSHYWIISCRPRPMPDRNPQ